MEVYTKTNTFFYFSPTRRINSSFVQSVIWCLFTTP